MAAKSINALREPMTLGEALPDEILRNVDLAIEYARLGAPGHIGCNLIRNDIAVALEAYRTDNVVLMLQAYQKLRENGN
jgi:hypothetical protein